MSDNIVVRESNRHYQSIYWVKNIGFNTQLVQDNKFFPVNFGDKLSIWACLSYPAHAPPSHLYDRCFCK